MGIFTIYENPDVDRKIQTELDIIIEEILLSIRPTTILLAGSFGRGEGSVLIQDNHIIPVMDYDLLIIAEKNSLLTEEELKDLKSRIIARCQSGEIERHVITDCHIDLFQSTLEQFQSNAHLSIYDMKLGSIVLYGDDIRDTTEIDIARLAPSACYFSLFRSIKSLLDIFSIEYLSAPPSDKNRFSMIFFCGKIYLHMGTQLSLCHALYHTSCRTRGERIKKEYPHFYTDLAKVAPDLPDKIISYSELTLSPDAIMEGSIDPVALWFETRKDFEIVMRYCLNAIGRMDSDDWVVLSDQMYYSLKAQYYSYFIEYWLEKRYNLRSGLMTSLVNKIYQFSKTPQSTMIKDKGIRSVKWRSKSPLLRLFALSPLLLFSLRNDGRIDNTLYSAFQKEFSATMPGIDTNSSRTDAAGWESTKDMLTKVLK